MLYRALGFAFFLCPAIAIHSHPISAQTSTAPLAQQTGVEATESLSAQASPNLQDISVRLHRELTALVTASEAYTMTLADLNASFEYYFWGAGQSSRYVFFENIVHTLQSTIERRALPTFVDLLHRSLLESLGHIAEPDAQAQVGIALLELEQTLRQWHGFQQAMLDHLKAQRPASGLMMTPTILESHIQQAIAQYAEVEKQIRLLRNTGASQEQFAYTFRRAELALGRVLDLWALTHQPAHANQHFGQIQSRLQIITGDLDQSLSLLSKHIQAIQKPPQPAAEDPSTPAINNLSILPNEHRIQLKWRAPTDPSRHHWRIYRLEEPGYVLDSPAQLACATPPGLENSKKIRIAEPEASRAQIELHGPPLNHRPSYAIVAVNPFGIESEALLIQPGIVFEQGHGPSKLKARWKSTDPTAAAFFANQDRVELTWTMAETHPMPATIQLTRRAAAQSETVTLPIHTRQYTDRIPVAWLGQPVTYSVVAIDENASEPFIGCESSVLLDGEQHLAHQDASLGAEWLNNQSYRALIRQASNQGEVTESFSTSSPMPALHRWWRSLSESERAEVVSNWRRNIQWASFVPDERTLLLSRSQHSWLQAALYYTAHPILHNVVTHYWHRFDVPIQTQAAEMLFGSNTTIPPSAREDSIPLSPTIQAHPLHIQAWHMTRPQHVKDDIRRWYNRLSSAQRQQYYQQLLTSTPAWFKTHTLAHPEDLQISQPHPALTQAPDFRAWAHWKQLPIAVRKTWIATRVPPLKQWLSNIHYRLRPLEQHFRFHLLWFILTGLSTLFSLVCLFRGWRYSLTTSG